MNDRAAALAEAYRRNIMKPEQRAAYEEAMRRGLVPGALNRSMGQRFMDQIPNSIARSTLGLFWRNADPDADGLQFRDFLHAPRVQEGGVYDWVLDRLGVGETLVERRGQTEAQRREIARRARYESRARQDPVRNIGDAAAATAGMVLGSLPAPENWSTAGLGKSVVGRALWNAAGAGAADVFLQNTDVAEGLSERYDPAQTGFAALTGGLISGGVDVASGAIRPVSAFVRRAFTEPVPPKPQPQAGATMPEGGQNPDATPAPAPPRMASVRPMEKGGAINDLARVVEERRIPEAVADWTARLYTAAFDDLHPIVRLRDQMRGDIEALAGKPMDIRAGDDPLKLARGRYDVFNIGHMDILHGVHDYRSTAVSTPALADVITATTTTFKRRGETAQAALDVLGEYAAARRAVVEWGRFERGEIPNPPVRETRAELEAVVAHLDSERPELRELSDAMNLYAQGLLKKRLDAGLIAQETYDSALAARDFYTPLRRVMDAAPNVGVAQTNKGPAVKAFGGSERDILNPVEVLVQDSYRLAQQVRQNELNLSLVKMAERLDRALAAVGDADGNVFMRKVKRPVSKVEMGDAAQPDLFPDDMPDVWKTGEINENGRAILYVWRGGKREAWELLDPEWGKMTFDAVNSMTKAQADLLADVLAAGTTMVSRAVTRDPSFLVANFIRDAFQAWTLTDVVKPGEGLIGVADELAQADSSRLYNLAGGISGGEASQAVGSTLRTRDVTEIGKRFRWDVGAVKERYFSDLQGFLRAGADAYRATELTETGSRRQVFKKAYARALKEGMTDYDALIEAGFTARDYADFGRHGSKVWKARRVITFLNPWAQGIDKLIRTAATDPASAVGRAFAQGGTELALKAILRPLFRNREGVSALPIRREDKAALQLAVHAWTRMSIMAAFGASLWALFQDDPDYIEANERARATHWIVPLGHGVVARIPKPFETAFMSNITERALEAVYGNDPTAWGRMTEGLVELFAPPKDVPLVNVAFGLATGVDPATNRPIVPYGTEQLDPELQYEWWTSQMAHSLGREWGIAPAKVDFLTRSLFGPFGSYAMALSDVTDPDRPAGSWIDAPVARRFFSPSFRGSQDKRDFYERVGANTSKLKRALNSVREYEERQQFDAARAIFDELDKPARLYVLSQRGEADTDRLNPLHRAQTVATHVGRLIGELNGGPLEGDGALALPPMTAVQRQMVMDQLEKIAVAEMGNAMIVTGQPGFAQRNMRDRDALWDELETMAPEVAREFEQRLRGGEPRAYDYAVVMESWPEVARRLEADGSLAELDDLARRATRKSKIGKRRDGTDDDLLKLDLFMN